MTETQVWRSGDKLGQKVKVTAFKNLEIRLLSKTQSHTVSQNRLMQRDQLASRASSLECSPNEGVTFHQPATGCSVLGGAPRNVPQAAVGSAYPSTLQGMDEDPSVGQIP